MCCGQMCFSCASFIDMSVMHVVVTTAYVVLCMCENVCIML